MLNGGLEESDIEKISFISTYNLQGNKGKTCTNFTEANIFLAANIIANNPNIDYCDFFSIISSKTIQILSAKTVLDRIDYTQKMITFDSDKTTGIKYEVLPGRIITLEAENIKDELLDSNTLCAVCEFENLELYETPIDFNAYDGLKPKAFIPMIRTLPIGQVKKLKELFFKKIYDKHCKTACNNKIFENEFGISFDNFKKLYINGIDSKNKNEKEIRSDFEYLVKQIKMFDMKSRDSLPPRQSKLEEKNIEFFNKLIQIEQQTVEDTIEIYSIINNSTKDKCFDLSSVRNIVNIPIAMFFIINNKKLNNEEKGRYVQNILISFNKDGKGILKKKELLNVLSKKQKFGESLCTQLDKLKEINKREGRPYRSIELFLKDLKHDIGMAVWHPETLVKTF